MTKSPNKVVLRKETLRLLSNKDLMLAMGGRDPDGVQQLAGPTVDMACPVAGLPNK
jgi:hypothetical protein